MTEPDTETERPRSAARRRWARVAVAAAVACYFLIVLGGVVRVTGSGMGCGDHWPLCNGRLVPPLDLPTLIEYGHRLAAAAVSLLVFALAALAWKPGRDDAWRPLRRVSGLALGLLLLQVALGAVTVKLDLPPQAIVLHLGTAMALLATLIVACCRGLATRRRRERDRDAFAGWTTAAAGFGFLVLVAGGLVANLHAAPACQGFPLCNGSAWPRWSNPLIAVHWGHRLLAYTLLIGGLWLPWLARRRRPADDLSRSAAASAAGLLLVQVAIGGAMVLGGLPDLLRVLHVAVGAAVFVALVWLAWAAAHPPAGARVVSRSADEARVREHRRAMDYVALTKPRIISLLLVTTVIPMFVAGSPGFWLVLWTVVGGYLMAGGANAINMYLDRDVDREMTRTRCRPIPSGRMSPLHVLGFGVLLAACAFGLFVWRVNLLAGLLALAGLAYYVFVYTRWLKRRTPQNIVIGGAAGAFPPLVGWAAVTGHVDLAALVLFLIVFYWTPPHFWALALVKREEYANARIPMAPVVWGEEETRRKMLLYTLVLLPLTLLPVLFGAFGVVYGLLALALGLRFLWLVVKLCRAREEREKACWAVYKYSLLYLALLFGAMLVDQAVPLSLTSHAEDGLAARSSVVHLRSAAPATAGGPVSLADQP